ncbi:hypothetical protein HK096_005347 [Nowakowskiella sp. JEL0078]|nr:hypothetical protein HK096_005347 [Nowakowskiella sp. JEL0078]
MLTYRFLQKTHFSTGTKRNSQLKIPLTPVQIQHTNKPTSIYEFVSSKNFFLVEKGQKKAVKKKSQSESSLKSASKIKNSHLESFVGSKNQLDDDSGADFMVALEKKTTPDNLGKTLNSALNTESDDLEFDTILPHQLVPVNGLTSVIEDTVPVDTISSKKIASGLSLTENILFQNTFTNFELEAGNKLKKKATIGLTPKTSMNLDSEIPLLVSQNSKTNLDFADSTQKYQQNFLFNNRPDAIIRDVQVPDIDSNEDDLSAILSEDQLDLLDLLHSGKNVYFTGKAGTGKTYVLKHYINFLRNAKKPGVAVLLNETIRLQLELQQSRTKQKTRLWGKRYIHTSEFYQD